MDSSIFRRATTFWIPAAGRVSRVLVLAGVGFALSMPEAPAAPPYRDGEVLVKFRGQATGVEIRRALGAREDRGRVAPGLEKVGLKPGESVEEAIAELRARPDVEYVQPNYIRRTQLTPNDRDFDYQWGLLNTGQVLVNNLNGSRGADVSATEAWNVTTGDSDVVIAVIDTGIDPTHPDLAGNLWNNPVEAAGNDGEDDDGNGYVDDVWGWDTVSGDNSPLDPNGHGTFVAGVLAARGNNGTAVAGVTWRASLMVLRAFDENGIGTTTDIIEAIDYAVENGARLINASFGSPGGSVNGAANFSPAEYEAIQHARDEGVLVVASACNYGADNDISFPDQPCVPASYDLSNIISVAATNAHDELWTNGEGGGSNYGVASVDLGAPGENVVTVAPTFNEVWSREPVFSGQPEPGADGAPIDLSDRQGCRAVVQYEQPATGDDRLEILAGRSVSALAVVASAGLKNGNFLGEPEVYADLSRFDGEPEVVLEARWLSSGQLVPDRPIGQAMVACYGPMDSRRYYASGTSLAAPFVTGAAALLLSKDNTLNVQALRRVLLNTVDSRAGLTGLVSTGGRLNIARALAAVGDDGESSTQSGNSGASGGGGGGGGLGGPLLLLLVVTLVGRMPRPDRR